MNPPLTGWVNKMAMPKDLFEHCDSIDAALFTGDAFHDEAAREELWAYIGRWTRELEATVDNNEDDFDEERQDAIEANSTGGMYGYEIN